MDSISIHGNDAKSASSAAVARATKTCYRHWKSATTEDKIIVAALTLNEKQGFPTCNSLLSLKSPFVKDILKHFNLSENIRNSNNVLKFLNRHVEEIFELSNTFYENPVQTNDEQIDTVSSDGDVENVAKDEPGNNFIYDAQHGNQLIDVNIDNVPQGDDGQMKFVNSKTSEIQTLMTVENELCYDDPHDSVVLDDLAKLQDSRKLSHKSSNDYCVKGAVTIAFPDVCNIQSNEKKKSDHRQYNKCTGNIGHFSIDETTWKMMTNQEGKLITTVYPTIIADKFYTISKGCVVQMKNVNYPKPNSRRKGVGKSKYILTIYAYCGHNKDTTFKFVCSKFEGFNNIEVEVFTNAQDCHHPTKKTRELSGIARDTMKHELINNSPTLVRLKCVNRCDPEGVKVNNVQDVKSYSVFRKAKAEALSVDDLHKNPMMDLFLMRDLHQGNEQNRYLQHVSHPFEVMMFTPKVLRLVEKAKYDSGPTGLAMHIDATGSVVRKIPQCQDKRVLYYALVFRVNEFVLPAAEFITCNHTAESVGGWLLKFKRFLIEQGLWPPCDRIVSDFSWALINAVMLQWNKMDVTTYLKWCHDKITKKEILAKPVVTLHVCVCHFVKNVTSHVKLASSSVPKENRSSVKQLFLQVICTIINCSCYDKIKTIMEYLITVLLCKKDCGMTQHALQQLANLCEGNSQIDEIPQLDDDLLSDVHNSNGKTTTETKANDPMYKKSPFYRDINDIGISIKRKLDQKDESNDESDGVSSEIEDNVDEIKTATITNKYYNPELVTILVDKYAPYLPLWSGILLRASKNDFVFQRQSNGPVENWFHQVKNMVLDGESNLRPNRFVRKLEDMVLSRCKEIELEIPKEGCARGKLKRSKRAKTKTQKSYVNNQTSTQTGKENQKREPERVERKVLSLKRKRNTPLTGDMECKRTCNNAILISSDSDIDNCEETWKKPIKKAHTYFTSDFLKNQVKAPFTMSSDAVEVIQNKVMKHNNLVDDPNYYVQWNKNINYVVCKTETPSGHEFDLECKEMNRLKGENWLSTDIMTGIGYMLLKLDQEKKSVIFHDNIGNMTIRDGQQIDKDHFLLKYSVVNENTEKLFFPINIANCHWVLAYANIKRCEFSYLDPLYEVNNALLEKYFKNFFKFWLDDAGKKQSDWKYKKIIHPRQLDNHNCGVFVMYFIDQLMKSDNIDMLFDPCYYRTLYFRNLLIYSKDMTNTCLTCNRTFKALIPDKPEHESVECTACFRWFHVKTCLPDDVPKDITILSKKDFKFYCYLCRVFYQEFSNPK